jgi:hypothetical protein
MHGFTAIEKRVKVFGILNMCLKTSADLMLLDFKAPLSNVYFNSATYT